MIRFTSAQLVDSMSRGDTSGEPMRLGAAIQQAAETTAVPSAANRRLFTVPDGQVFLVTQVVAQAEDSFGGILTASNVSPAKNTVGFDLLDGSGAPTPQSALAFLSFSRWQSVLEPNNVANFRTAAPGNAIVWKPKWALPIPSGWTMKWGQTVSGQAVNSSAVYGYLVDENTAANLGYQVEPGTTDLDRRHGIETLAVSGTLVAGRAGKSIRVLDVTVRMQPDANGTNTLTLRQTGDQRVMSRWTNNNPSDFLNVHISPGDYWFTKPGQGLEIVCTNNVEASITMHYEIVDEDEVPGDVWWTCFSPVYASPALASPVLAHDSEELVLYYPGRDEEVSAADATDQHRLAGYAINIQKDTDNTSPDQPFLALSTGTSGGRISLNLAPIGGATSTQTNYQLTPVFAAPSHDQCVFVAVDGIDVPCAKGGSIWVDKMTAGNGGLFAVASTTPTNTTSNISAWSVSAWGKTRPAYVTARSNEGQ